MDLLDEARGGTLSDATVRVLATPTKGATLRSLESHFVRSTRCQENQRRTTRRLEGSGGRARRSRGVVVTRVLASAGGVEGT
ncbi:hypothetical protein EV1_040009 [Malus domestica]